MAFQVFPYELPPAMVGGYSVQHVDICRSVKWDQGELRRRQKYSKVPEVLTVSWTFNPDQFDIFEDWYENNIIAGSRDFDVKLAGQGIEEYEWYTAMFLSPYEAEIAQGSQAWEIRARLLIREKIGTVRPETGIFSGSGSLGFGSTLAGLAHENALHALVDMSPMTTPRAMLTTGDAVAAGRTLTAVISFIRNTGGASGSGAGQTLTATASFIAGTAVGGTDASAAGVTLAVTASFIAGSAVGDLPGSVWNTSDTVTSASGFTYSEGNARAIGEDNGLEAVRGVQGRSSGKYYFEIECVNRRVDDIQGWIAGCANSAETLSYYADMADGIRIESAGYVWKGSNQDPFTPQYSVDTGDVIGIAMDLDAKTMDLYWNNTLIGSHTFTGTKTFKPYYANQTIGIGSSGANEARLKTASGSFTYSPPATYSAWG